MKTILSVFFFFVVFLLCHKSFAQHSLQLDDGLGHYSILTAANPGGNYLLPSGGGTLLTNTSLNGTVWLLNGNTIPSGVDGTNNNLGSLAGSALTPVNIVVNGIRIMRYDGATICANIIGGRAANAVNTVPPLTVANFIGGGGVHTINGGNSSVITGGLDNTINAIGANFEDVDFIGGGYNNSINSAIAGVNYTGLNTIVGGWGNFITSNVVGGGQSGFNFIGGGYNSSANGDAGLQSGFNTVTGGYQNHANGGPGNQSGWNFVGGGILNNANGDGGGTNTIVGGYLNTANGGSGNFSGWNFIGGGDGNNSYGGVGDSSGGNMIGGGYHNTATGSGAFQSGSNTIGGGWNNTASGGGTIYSGFNTVCGGKNNIASPAIGNGFIFVGGGEVNLGNNLHASVGGGYGNHATGNASAIFGGSSNGASGDGAFIGGGGFDGGATSGNIAAGNASVIAGGFGNKSSQNYSAVGGGKGNLASGYFSTVPGGGSNTASGNYSMAIGADALATSYGQFTQAIGKFSVHGDAQTSVFVLRNQTANAAATSLFLDGAALRIPMPANGAMTFHVLIVGKVAGNAAPAVGGWEIIGTAFDNAGAVNIAGANILRSLNTPAGWGIPTVTGNGASIDIQVTGAAATTIDWVARIETSEIQF